MSTRQSWAVIGGLLVTAFAGVLHLLGADGADVVGTFLFGVVFAATLLSGQVAGFVAAAVATGLYAWLRREAADDAGMAKFAVVVIGRAASYFVLAYVTHVMQDRLPAVNLFGGNKEAAPGAPPARRRPRPAREAEALSGYEEPEGPPAWVHEPEPAAWGAAPPAERWDDAPSPLTVGANGDNGAGLSDRYSPPDAGWVDQEPAVADDTGGYDTGGYDTGGYDTGGYDTGGYDTGGYDTGGYDTGGYGADQATYPSGEWAPAGGRADQVPAGWMQDDVYGGDEIPVGYTGELFLNDLAGSGDDPSSNDFALGRDRPVTGDVPMIDGMPFGQPLGQAPGLGPGSGYPGPDGYEQPGHDESGYGQSDYDQGYGQPDYDEPSYEQGGYGQSDYGQPDYNQSGYGQPDYNQGGYQGLDTGPEHSWSGPREQAAGMYEAPAPVPHIDPETRLWTAGYFRDRLAEAYDSAHQTGSAFSVIMIQIPDTPFHTLSHRRQVALLRELGHQFIRAQVVDHLVHLPDGAQHWFAVVLADTDKSGALGFERRLRSAIAGYLRNRGLGLEDIQSAALTSPDDDEMMSAIWSSLLGQQEADEQPVPPEPGRRW